LADGIVCSAKVLTPLAQGNIYDGKKGLYAGAFLDYLDGRKSNPTKGKRWRKQSWIPKRCGDLPTNCTGLMPT
jgi:hypothetical protein